MAILVLVVATLNLCLGYGLAVWLRDDVLRLLGLPPDAVVSRLPTAHATANATSESAPSGGAAPLAPHDAADGLDGARATWSEEEVADDD